MFGHIVNSLMLERSASKRKTIKSSDYEFWKKLYTFDALKNLSYGQSFCNHFGITDHRIFYERDWSRCDNTIRREWLATS